MQRKFIIFLVFSSFLICSACAGNKAKIAYNNSNLDAKVTSSNPELLLKVIRENTIADLLKRCANDNKSACKAVKLAQKAKKKKSSDKVYLENNYSFHNSKLQEYDGSKWTPAPKQTPDGGIYSEKLPKHQRNANK